MAEYLSTDPNAGKDSAPKYLSTDPNAGAAADPLSVPDSAPKVAPVKERPASMSQKLYGIVDAAHTLASGAVGGTAGALTAAGAALLPSNYGTQEGAARAQGTGAKVADFLTRKPGEKGAEYVEKVARLLEESKLAGIAPEIPAVSRMRAPSAATRIEASLPTKAGAKEVLTAAEEAFPVVPGAKRLYRAPEQPKAETPKPPAAKPAAQSGEAAQRVTDELQRIRNSMEGIPTEGPNRLSEYEVLRKRLEDKTTPLRELAFASGATVDVDHAVKVIERMESSNVDKNVLAALKQAKDTIADAVKKSNPQAEVIQTASGPMMVKDNKLVPATKSTGARIDMADEIRQSLERQIQSRPDGQPLSGHTQALLREIQDAVTAKSREASPRYGQYLDEYAKNAKALEKFSPEQTVLGKVTSGAQEFQRLTGVDAQKSLESAFSGKRPERDLATLVELTKHNPEATSGLRTAFKDWLIQRDPAGGAKAGDIIKRWRDVGSAVEKSGLYAPEKVAELNAIMQGLAKSEGKGKISDIFAGTLGFIGGSKLGHPVGGAITGKKIAKYSTGRSEKKAIDLLEQIMSEESK